MSRKIVLPTIAALMLATNTATGNADTEFEPAHTALRLIEELQDVLTVRLTDAAAQAHRAHEARQAEAARHAAEEAEARRPKRVYPTTGVLTSGFGARWGVMHQGIDIANAIGTPIRSAADGVVVEAGPAQGFGLWIRVRHDDGTVTVYGHVDRFTVPTGKRVRAGEEIAKMGNRGQSTGPHLHFEVWQGGRKVDPLSWLP
ncbi:hypothetical protein Lesp02_01950 [Lentzea sp. NBRC 105346]|uniref:M23 family metallopeptidase n=1 Tax=Lentzea sp. NBRC 105346 TaxID=3032205 RepID=UPI0024A18015|nr:M23 family metallopeptidase [Lentzea sp. NBRC 105346]GLZ28005.1 hypothetical protein Lesp02_01950 [Lentzea sp. NBRC 105346]